jgi:hypothetical protein
MMIIRMWETRQRFIANVHLVLQVLADNIQTRWDHVRYSVRLCR